MKLMKKSHFGIGLVLSVTLGMFAQTAARDELSAATFVPLQHHTNTGIFAWFDQEIDKRSGGTLIMKIYPTGQLGAGPVQMPVTEMYTGLSTGTIDATTSSYNNITPPWNFGAWPHMWLKTYQRVLL